MASTRHVRIGDLTLGNDRPLAVIAGPCALESRAHALEMSQALAEMAAKLGIGLIYKTSYDKANRTSLASERGLGLDLHIVISVLAYSLLAIAACQALLLAYQDRRLRRKQPGRVLHVLPPLQVQESLLFQLIGVGFFMLSLSLVSGVMFVEDIFAQHLAHKTALSLVAWVVFGVLLWGRWRHGWRGRTAIRWSLAGAVFLALAYFGSKLVLELVLGRSWLQ